MKRKGRLVMRRGKETGGKGRGGEERVKTGGKTEIERREWKAGATVGIESGIQEKTVCKSVVERREANMVHKSTKKIMKTT